MFEAPRTALAFLTLLPVGAGEVSSVRLGRSAVFFPLAGWVIGLCLACGAWLFAVCGIRPLPAAVLLVAFEAVLTRGLHLDGVADLFDGLGGGFSPEKRLAIMKDSATGAFGVVGLVLTLGLKGAALASLLTAPNGQGTLFNLVLFLAVVPAAARWAMLTLAWKSRYPRPMGTGHVFVGRITSKQVVLAALFLLPVLLLPGRSMFFFLLGCLLPAMVLRYLAHRLLGGVTGDVLGACCEFAEALGWLLLTIQCH